MRAEAVPKRIVADASLASRVGFVVIADRHFYVVEQPPSLADRVLPLPDIAPHQPN